MRNKKNVLRNMLLLVLLFILVGIPLVAQVVNNEFYVATTVDSAGIESVNSNEAAAAVSTAQKTVTLSWTAAVAGSNPIAGYNIYRGTKTGGTYVKIGSTAATILTYVDVIAPANPPGALQAVVSK